MATIPYPESFPNVIVHTTINNMKIHPSYIAAKNGDVSAALSLISDVSKKDRIEKLASYYPDAILIPVHELILENGRYNAIPLVYAEYISDITGHEVCYDIYQKTKASHTNKNAIERLINRSQFAGDVKPGKTYIIVDDVITQGGTVSELRSYIENAGGKVACVSTLSFSKFSMVLGIKKETISDIERKFGKDETKRFIKEFGIGKEIEHLTNGEGKYILSFSSLDRIRDRIFEIRDSKQGARDQKTIEESEKQFMMSEIEDSLNISDSILKTYSTALMKLRIKKELLANKYQSFEWCKELFEEKEDITNTLLNTKLKNQQITEYRSRIRKINIHLSNSGFTDYKNFLNAYNLFVETYPRSLGDIDKSILRMEDKIDKLKTNKDKLITDIRKAEPIKSIEKEIIDR